MSITTEKDFAISDNEVAVQLIQTGMLVTGFTVKHGNLYGPKGNLIRVGVA